MTLGRSVGRSDTGRKRRHNEDSFVLAPPLFAVADGMGGAQAGEIASGLAAETVRSDTGDGDGLERVTALVQAANKRVYERSRDDTTVTGMGTTMTLALLGDGVVSIGHVGDSRAYLIRDGELRQLTNDHSLVAELMRSGRLTPEEAEHHPQRSVITRALGTDANVDVDTYTVEPQPGDVFLLCSDGLTSMVGHDEILRIIEKNRDDLDATAQALIAAANQGGGEDNITVVCFEIASETAPTVERRAAEPDEEDTLSPIDRVPAVTTMVVPPERIDEVFVEHPEQPPTEKGARGKRVLVTLGLLVLLAVLAALLVWGTAS